MTEINQTSDEDDEDGSAQVDSPELKPSELFSEVLQLFKDGKTWNEILPILSDAWQNDSICLTSGFMDPNSVI